MSDVALRRLTCDGCGHVDYLDIPTLGGTGPTFAENKRSLGWRMLTGGEKDIDLCFDCVTTALASISNAAAAKAKAAE